MTVFPMACIEGCDGAGKTTLVNAVVQYLHDLGYDTFKVSFPSRLTVSGQFIRRQLEAGAPLSPGAAYHFLADMADLAPEIAARQRHGVVVTDRYTLSTLVYQGIKADLIDSTKIMVPDLMVYCKAPIEQLIAVAQERRSAKRLETFDTLDQKIIEERVLLYELYLSLMKTSVLVADMRKPVNDLAVEVGRAIIDLCPVDKSRSTSNLRVVPS